jgi:hypothetical protein
MKMDAARFSDTLVTIYQTPLRHIPVENCLYILKYWWLLNLKKKSVLFKY